MFAKRTILLLAAAFLLPLFVSCSDDNNERMRSVVEISAVGNGGIVTVAPWNAGNNKRFPDDPTNPDDFDDERTLAHVPITVKNRAYNEYVTAPDYTPYGHFHVTQVSVNWIGVSSAAPNAAAGQTTVVTLADLQAFNFSAMYDIAIPRDAEMTFEMLLIPQAALTTPLFNNLAPGINGHGGDASTVPFIANAQITLRGHESGSEDEYELVGHVLAEFVGFVIDE